jgi:hypothetical protein
MLLEETPEGTFTSYCQGMYFYKEAGQTALQPEVMPLYFCLKTCVLAR